MREKFPETVQKYAESPEFTQDTVPEKLTRLHDTKRGVWGKLCVLRGALRYIVPGPPFRAYTLTEKTVGIIRPEEQHRVEITEPVIFKIEFYK